MIFELIHQSARICALNQPVGLLIDVLFMSWWGGLNSDSILQRNNGCFPTQKKSTFWGFFHQSKEFIGKNSQILEAQAVSPKGNKITAQTPQQWVP